MSAVHQHAAAADTYIRHGWRLCPIEPGTKGPTTPDWNSPENALQIGQLPVGWGAGLMHSLSGTCALDVDNFDLAARWFAERGVDLLQLFKAPDAVGIDSGNPGHCKLLFALPTPLKTKRISVVQDGKRTTAFEFRCASKDGRPTQDVLPPARHPSGTTYRWAGAGNWQALPALPFALQMLWQQLIEDETRRSIPAGDSTPANLAEVEDALNACDPDCDRHAWIELGMAVQVAAEHAGQPDEGFRIWSEWSAKGKKYKASEMNSQWRSFKPTPNGITVATVFHHAKLGGWKRPPPDVADLFKPVPPAESADVVDLLNIKTPCPKVNLDLWPDLLRQRAVEVADTVGCDPIVPMMAGLCALSGAVDKRTRLILNSTWAVPPTVWGMTIGEPADKKTPGSKPMFAPLYKLEREDRQRYEAEMMTWIGKEAAYASALKAFRDHHGDPESQLPGGGDAAPGVPPLPLKPEPLRLLVNDTTSQKVVHMAAGRPRGFLVYMDEMNRWLSNLSNPRSTEDRGCWIHGYEAGPYTMDRVGAGTIAAEHLALSMYGNCQPGVFAANVEAGSADGMIQRFLPVVINPAHNAMWQHGLPAFLTHEHQWEQLIRRTYAMPQFDYQLSPDGMEAFREFCEWCLKVRDDERIIQQSAAYQTALGKLEGNCARVMLLFHIIGNPYDHEIPRTTVRRTCRLFQEFFYLSLRYVFNEIGSEGKGISQNVFDLVLQWASVRPTITLHDIRSRTKHLAKEDSRRLDERIRSIMDDLTAMGYVTMHQDHPRYPVWAINPAIADAHAKHRANIIKRKRELVDNIKRVAEAKHDREIDFGNPVIGA